MRNGQAARSASQGLSQNLYEVIRRTTDAIRTLEPSSMAMISLACQVCAVADWSV